MEDILDERHANSILLFLLHRGRIKKTDLLEVVSSSDSLSKTLRRMEEEGLIVVETKIMGRKTILIDLTPKGAAIAHHLKRAEEAASGASTYEIPPDFGKEFEGLSAMTHLNVLDDHIAITEHNYDGTGRDRIVMVYVKLNGRGFMRLWCELDNSYDCRHTRYAWTLPSVQEMVQVQKEKGNMKEQK